MGRIVVTEFISLDGVIEAPGGGDGFEHAGWTFQFDAGEAGGRFKVDEVMNAESLLLGRATYDDMAAAWPLVEGDFADRMNALPKHVVTSTPGLPAWSNSAVLEGDVAESVSALRRAAGGDVLVFGSAMLVQTLVENDLVDELRLMLFPIVLGSGKRLFGTTTATKRLHLAETRSFGDGISLLVLRSA